jgi:hypothetical protein
MGPRPRGRGIYGPNARVGRCQLQHQLQWGRDRAVAELIESGGVTLSNSSRRIRFNGAATARSRNCLYPCSQEIQRFSMLASMGPRPRGRGISNFFTTGEGQRSLSIASMGPRPRGRGITITALRRPAARRSSPRLQWGRDRAVAELWLDVEYGHIPVASLRLQWGRDRAVAELCGRRAPAALVPCAASMGPRPRGRGIRQA